jgi:hypothetical protein
LHKEMPKDDVSLQSTGALCYEWRRINDEEHKINHSGDTRFNMENPPNAEGKNHGR